MLLSTEFALLIIKVNSYDGKGASGNFLNRIPRTRVRFLIHSTGSINACKPRNTRLKLIDPWCAGCVRARVFTRMLNTCVGAWYPLTTRLNHFLRLLLDFPWDAAVASCLLLLTILALIYSGVFFIFARAFLEKLHRATNFILRACLKKFYYFSSLFILFFFLL